MAFFFYYIFPAKQLLLEIKSDPVHEVLWKLSLQADDSGGDQKQSVFHVISPVELVLRIPVQVHPFHVIADGGFEESQLYYTTPQAKKQAGNAGNARGKRRKSLTVFPADFLPGACRTGARRTNC